jgi:hypothetical protein
MISNRYLIGTGFAFLVLFLIWITGVGLTIALPLMVVTVGLIVAIAYYSGQLPDLVALFGGGIAVLLLLIPAPSWISFWVMLLGVTLICSAIVGSNGGGMRNTVAGGLHVAGTLLILGATVLIFAQKYSQQVNSLLNQTGIEYRFDTAKQTEDDRQLTRAQAFVDSQKEWKIVTPNEPNGLPLNVKTLGEHTLLTYRWKSGGQHGTTKIQVSSTESGSLKGRFETSKAGSVGPAYGTVNLEKKFQGCFAGTLDTEAGQRVDIAVRRAGVICRP